MKPIKVAVNGALGRMGREVVKAVCREPGMEVVGAIEVEVNDKFLPLPDGSGLVPFADDLEYILSKTKPDVVVDFTNAEVALMTARLVARSGVNLVIGTTGLAPDEIGEIEHLTESHQVGAVVAPNFALGAVLLMHLAKMVAPYFDSAEIIELHHNQKADSPSGTALATAKAMAAARGKPFSLSDKQRKASDSRGKRVEQINIHSVRLPGLMAHQEVILGGLGQTLSLRHDTISRECYMPGVILAIKKVVKHPGLIYGLDHLLGL